MIGIGILVALAAASCLGGHPADEQDDAAYRHRERAMPYAGPGRDDPPPDELRELTIGWFGPDDPAHPLYGGMWTAATMAVEEANARCDDDAPPFRLVPVWSENPWGSGVKEVARLAFAESVWGFVGAPDSASAHLVEQVTAKARLAFVNPASTDKSANLAGVPWIFSVAPGDHEIAPVLVDALLEAAGGGAIAMVTDTDHDSRLLTHELFAVFAARGSGPELHLELPADVTSVDRQLADLRVASPAAIAIVAGPLESARLVRELRAAGFEQRIVCGPSAARRAFLEHSGAAAEGVRFPLLWDAEATGARARNFADAFERRTGVTPDYTEAFTYDAVTLLLAALDRAGPNRVRIGDEVRALSPWSGAGGVITWDRTGQNTRQVSLGVWREGRRVRIGE